jgi:hypothetical protein
MTMIHIPHFLEECRKYGGTESSGIQTAMHADSKGRPSVHSSM